MSRSPRATRRTPDSWNCGSSANWTSRRRPSTSLQKPWRGERLPAPGPPEQPSAVAWLAPPPVVQTTPLSNRGPLSVRGRPCLRRRTGAVLAVRGPQTGDDPRVGSFYVNLILDIIFGAFALVVGTSSILADS